MNNIHPIVRRRHVAMVAIRTVALIALLVGTFSIFYAVGRGLQLGGGWSAMKSIFEWPAWFGLALATLVPGIGLIALDGRIVRWLVPVPRNECPRCAYDLNKNEASRCPECGFNLAA